MVSDEKINVWNELYKIPDPEIPMLTIGELGVLRKVEKHDVTWYVYITPTYSGCPAMHMFEEEIKRVMETHQWMPFEIKTIYHPAWTTDWLSEEAKEKLRKAGIAPPEGSASKKALLGEPDEVTCPKCGKKDTKKISEFGSTACKALYFCNNCKDPFEYFKCL